jgi:hypothetical protein
LPAFRITVRTSYGELGVEGDTIEELKNRIKEIGMSNEQLESVLKLATNQLNSTHTVQTDSVREVPPQYKAAISPDLIGKLDSMSNRDLVMALLYYEGPVMTKKEMLSQSIEWGKSIAPLWLDKKFSEDMGDLVVKTKGVDASPGYKLSNQGRYKANLRMNELISSPQQKS